MHDRYVPFDPSQVDLDQWWLRSQNYDAAVLLLIAASQMSAAGALVNFGSDFRQSWWRNYGLAMVYLAACALIAFLTLTSNWLTCLFFINCDQSAFAGANNVMPVSFRLLLLILLGANMLAVLLFERLLVLGPFSRWVRTKLPRRTNVKV